MREKLLLDTDIGSDIDDAVCLAYLLAQTKCELLGITTVTGEPVKRAMMASALCRLAGRQVPIYPGCASPLLVPLRQVDCPQAAALGDLPHETSFPEGEAISFLRSTIRKHPGEVTLLAIGPMTNVGLLFAQDPEIPSLLKRLVLMCGVFTTRIPNAPRVEWNALGDPHATAVVYAAGGPVHRSIGLDVTLQVTMPSSEVKRRFEHPLLRAVRQFAEVWFRYAGAITFHDPLAAATIFDDGICGFEKGTVNVELASARLAGFTHWDADAAGRHEVALTVDAGRFFREYFSVFA